MNTSTMERLVAAMNPDEIRDRFWLAGVFEDWGKHVVGRGRRVAAADRGAAAVPQPLRH